MRDRIQKWAKPKDDLRAPSLLPPRSFTALDPDIGVRVAVAFTPGKIAVRLAIKKPMRVKLKAVKVELRKRMHDPIAISGATVHLLNLIWSIGEPTSAG